MKKKTTKNPSLSKTLLKYLLISGSVMLVLSSPMGASLLLRRISKERMYTKRQMQNTLYYLNRKGCISVHSVEKEDTVSLTKKGRIQAEKYYITEDFVFPKSKWDGKWRIIIFDISSKRKTARDALRMTLRRVGCRQMQKSVWVYPFACNREIVFIRKAFRVSKKELRIITAVDVEDEGVLRTAFHL